MLAKWPRLFLVLAGLACLSLIAGTGWYYWYHHAGPEPPVLQLAATDPEVAQAIEQARQGTLQARRSAEAWGKLGLVLAAHDYFGEAETCFAQAEHLDPREPRWPYYHALSLRQGKPDAALPKLERAVELWGDRTATARLWLAETYLEQGRFDEAHKHFYRHLRRHPEDLRTHYGLGRLAYERGDLASSLVFLGRSVQSPYARRASHTLLAKIYQRQGDSSAAGAEMRHVASLPDDPPWPDQMFDAVVSLRVGKMARMERVTRLINGNQFSQALLLLNQLVRDYPEFEHGWVGLGSVHLRLQNLPVAQRALEMAVQLKPDLVKARFLLGVALLHQAIPEAAAPHFRKVIELKPDEAQAYFHLGQCLQQQGNQGESLIAFRAAARLNPRMIEAHVGLSELLLEQGRFMEAFYHLHNALALDPGHEPAKKLLPRVLARWRFPSSF